MTFKTFMAGTAALSLVFAASAASADEGMWTFDNFPAAKVKAAYGVTIDKAWLDHVRLGTGRIPGCSASEVSGNGLVLTNYHCVAGCVQALSTAQVDYLKDGYIKAVEERRCPGMFMEVLQSIQDVTGKVKAAGVGKAGRDLVAATGAETAAIEKASCANTPQNRCQVISLYNGGQYKLYTFRRYDDVRLVFAPEFKTGFFGGDPDNFNFPRYNLDFGLLRLYADGKPMATPDHLRWNPETPKAGEPIFVVGNPGSTSRGDTVAQLESARDWSLPHTTILLSERRGRLIRFTEESEENARVGQDVLEGLENSFKVFNGRMISLTQEDVMSVKRREEAQLRARVAANKTLAASTGDPWKQIADAEQVSHDLVLPYAAVEGAGGGSALFSYAKTLVRAAAEREKLSADRLPEYSDSRLPQIEHGLLAPRPVEASLEELNLEFWLSKSREYLTADDPNTKLLLGKESPEELAARLVKDSHLDKVEARKALWDGGEKAILASDDPMIKYVLSIDPQARALRKEWEARVVGPIAAAEAKIAAARFAVYGDSIYPDATFSPRITYGAVAGWTERGHQIPPVTHMGGLFERATGLPPFDPPQSWYAAKDRLNLDTVFDFSGTLDITGGNSGSPTLNAKGDVIGAVFDGNIHSLGGDYAYDPKMNRSVSVSAAAIQEALSKIYGREDLVKELNAN
ncbi:MAG TPA: S46 family peptidase [Caulobacteraceae bacterium]|nr:S46 family peptidase [Caulobacteraceae bacterium]